MLDRKTLTFSNLIFLLLMGGAAFAQAGANDPTFNPTDIGFGNGDGANDVITSTALQADGKIIIAGGFTTFNGTGRNHIARLTANGNLDTSFNPGSGANGEVNIVLLQANGKIIIIGPFTLYNGIARHNLARLNADGSLDPGFDPQAGTNDPIYSAALQSDGHILIAGVFSSYNNINCNHIARLTADGYLDDTFQPGTGPNDMIRTIAFRPDAKIIIQGSFDHFNGTPRPGLALLNFNGSLDTSFNPGTGAEGWVSSMGMRPDGRIILAGYFPTYDGIASEHMAQVNLDGSLDTSFISGTGPDYQTYAYAFQPDGKIIIGGNFNNYNGVARKGIARLNEDGSLDMSFDPGVGFDYPVLSILLSADGELIPGGFFARYNNIRRNCIAKLSAEGGLDPDFNIGSGSDAPIFSSMVQSDGKILISGSFNFYNGILHSGILRINMDGSVDTTFVPGLGAIYPSAIKAILADGKILLTGVIQLDNGTVQRLMLRMNVDGGVDTSFHADIPGNAAIYGTAVQPDGKILLSGFLDGQGNGNTYFIERLNVDGSVDASFDAGTGPNESPTFIALQADGNILIGGSFTTYNGIDRHHIARLHPDGSLDTSFDPGTGTDSNVWTVAPLSDGKIFIGGGFSNVNGIARANIARLNEDGSLDTGFDPGSGTNNSIGSITLLPNGKFMIIGAFGSYNGTLRNGIARINADGDLDTDFDPGSGPNEEIISTALQADGKLIIGGYCTAYNGTGRNRIARILMDGVAGIDEAKVEDANVLHLWPNPNDGKRIFLSLGGFDHSLHNVTVQLVDATGRQVLATTLPVTDGNLNSSLQLGHLTNGPYLLQIIAGNWAVVQRMVVGH